MNRCVSGGRGRYIVFVWRSLFGYVTVFMCMCMCVCVCVCVRAYVRDKEREREIKRFQFYHTVISLATPDHVTKQPLTRDPCMTIPRINLFTGISSLFMFYYLCQSFIIRIFYSFISIFNRGRNASGLKRTVVQKARTNPLAFNIIFSSIQQNIRRSTRRIYTPGTEEPQ